MKEYVITVDLGKRRDYTTAMVFRDVPQIVDGIEKLRRPDRIIHFYDVVRILKFNGVPYPEVRKILLLLVNHRDLVNNHELIIDGTGVGDAVVDFLRDVGITAYPIISTGGGAVHEVSASFGSLFDDKGDSRLSGMRVIKEIHVPKKDLVDAGSLIAQQGRVRVVPGLKHADDFRRQMEAFRGKFNETRSKRPTFEAETEEDHDDLVVDYLMASWWFLNKRKEIEDRVIEPCARENRDWNPYDYLL